MKVKYIPLEEKYMLIKREYIPIEFINSYEPFSNSDICKKVVEELKHGTGMNVLFPFQDLKKLQTTAHPECVMSTAVIYIDTKDNSINEMLVYSHNLFNRTLSISNKETYDMYVMDSVKYTLEMYGISFKK